MRFGISLPHAGGNAMGDVARNIAEAAISAEVLGFDSLWVADHIVFPTTEIPQKAHVGPVRSGGRILEPLAVLSFVAALTKRIKLGTSVLVLPYRNALVVAKEYATLDVLSHGRLILGVGAGWLR